MARDPIADQPMVEIEDTCDELSDQDREAAEEAGRALLFLDQQMSSPPPGDAGSIKKEESTAAMEDDSGPLECRFSVPAACLVAAIAAVQLPPSELSKLINRDEKPLTRPLHRLCLSVDSKGLRLTNRKAGVACELTIAVATFSASDSAKHSFSVGLAHLQGLFPDRPYRHGKRRLDEVNWAKIADVELTYCATDRRVTVRVAEARWHLRAEPCDTPEPLSDIAGKLGNHQLIARTLEKAIRYAGTFSSLGRKDPMYGVISVEDGIAWGGFPAAATHFQSAILKGISFDIAVADAPAVRSVLLRLRDFRMLVDGERLLIADNEIRVEIELAKRRVPDISRVISAGHNKGIAVNVPLHQLFHAAVIATLLQTRETDLQPIYIDAVLCKEGGSKLLTLWGITPAGHASRVSIALAECDASASGEILWTARSAHLKRAADPVDYSESAEVIAAETAVLLVVERHGAVITHVLSRPKAKRPPVALIRAAGKADGQAAQASSDSADQPEQAVGQTAELEA